MQVPVGSPELRGGFVALSIVLALLFVAAVYVSSLRSRLERGVAVKRAGIAALLTAAWLAFTRTLASRGALHFSPPPTMLLLIAATFVLAISLAFSPVGRRIVVAIPLWALVGFQGFRVVVELLLHRAYLEGLMPIQMSYSGRNFDIVSGITALLLGGWLATGRQSRQLVAAWNALGLLLLANILVIALLSAPTPLRVFMNEPANVWITQAPWVWLPTVMVFGALLGHLVVFRRLALEKERATS